MKKTTRILLSILVVLCMAFTAVGCGNDSKTPDNSGNQGGTQTVEATYYDVTAVNGTIKGKDYNHDKVKEGEKITIVANTVTGVAADTFDGWYDGTTKVSDSAEYELTVTGNTTLVAQYGITYSTWDGVYPTTAPAGFVEDEENHTWHIKSAEALAWWANLVNANDSGASNDINYPYTTFHRQWYIEKYIDHSSDYDDDLIFKPDNAWTLSLECNIDMDGQNWTPVSDGGSYMNGLTFEGNGHIIKNMSTKWIAAKGPAIWQGCGFFGVIVESNLTIQNITFDSAVAYADAHGNNTQNLGIVISGIQDGSQSMWFGDEYRQTVKFDNVNVINSSIIGGNYTAKSGFLIGRVGSADAWGQARQHIIVNNCTLDNNFMDADNILGAVFGMIYTTDAPGGVQTSNPHTNSADGGAQTQNQTLFSVNNLTVTNFKAITGDTKSPVTHTDYFGHTVNNYGSHIPGTFGCWEQRVDGAFLDTPVFFVNGNWMSLDAAIDYDLIDLNLSTSNYKDTSKDNVVTPHYTVIARSNYLLKDALVDEKAEIFITQKFEIKCLDELSEYTGKLYLVGGVTLDEEVLAELDASVEIYTIGYERDNDGELIVLDADGEAVGRWVEGALVAGSYDANGNFTEAE